MPPLAASKQPGRSLCAPVNAPFSCPKSSLSISVSGIAPQFSATNGSSARSLSSCRARAATSLPVPLSPVIRTVICVPAARRRRSETRAMAGEAPTSRPRPRGWRPAEVTSLTVRSSSAWRSAPRTEASSRIGSRGLGTKSTAPLSRQASAMPGASAGSGPRWAHRGPASPAGVHDRPRRGGPGRAERARPNRRPARAAPAPAWRLRAARGPGRGAHGPGVPGRLDRPRPPGPRAHAGASGCGLADARSRGLAGRWEAEGATGRGKRSRANGWWGVETGPGGS